MILGRILERLMQRGYTRDALRRGRSDRRGRGSGEAASLFGRLGRDFRAIYPKRRTAPRRSPTPTGERSLPPRRSPVRISMDGKGRWPGNVYVERLWRSPQAGRSLPAPVRDGGLRCFNEERPRQGLDNRTPDDVFYKRKLPIAA